MKIIKQTLKLCLLALIAFSCSQDDMNTDYVNEIAAPSNVSAAVRVTQDNTGLVTITPLGQGVVNFNVNFGDGSNLAEGIIPGKSATHTYAEGTYEATIIAKGLNGLSTAVTQSIVVSFKAPENLVVTIENDAAISKKVNVTVTADYALSYEVYFGEPGNDTPVTANIGEVASYRYQDAGTYTIRIVVMSAAIETAEYSVEFEVTAILQPLASAPAPPYRNPSDVISVFSAAYTNIGVDYFPDWGQAGQGSGWTMFDLNGDEMLQYINLSYQGNQFDAPVNVTAMEYIHMDVWTASEGLQMETSLISLTNGEKPVWSDLTANEWTSIDIPISAFTDQGLTVADIHQLKYVAEPWAAGTVFIDNIYFYKSPSSTQTGVVGTWKIAPEAGSLRVGPAPGDGQWWSIDAAGVVQRACFYDDTYVFNSNGSFSNILGTDTWIEGWQGGGDACGAPVAPYDGTASATYTYDENAGTVTVNGTGAYLGIPKANNAGELPNVAVPSSITYNITLSNNDTRMTLIIEAGAGVFWTFELVRDNAPSLYEGTWKIAPIAGSLRVGPAPGDGQWWSIDAAGVSQRACFYDDEFVFGADGSFNNILGSQTWIEGWQGGGDACGTPVAPYDGTASATYTYDSNTVTINGTGAYLGIPKANNSGELPNVAVPNSITYDVTFSNNNTRMTLIIEAGAGVFWTFELDKQ